MLQPAQPKTNGPAPDPGNGRATFDLTAGAPPVSPSAEDVDRLRSRAPRLSPGDADRVVTFVHLEQDRVLAAVGSVCGPGADTQGAVAEAVARLVEQLARGRSIENLAAWVTRTAINVGRSERRHAGVHARKLPLLRSREDATYDDGIIAGMDLERALAALPTRQAQVIALRYRLDLPIAEIAAVLGLSVGGTKASLVKARRSLAAAIGGVEEGDERG